MNYQQAVKKITQRRIVGFVVTMAGVVLFLATLLKFLALQSMIMTQYQATYRVGNAILGMLKDLDSLSFSPFLLWDYVPEVEPENLLSLNGAWFLCIYLAMFIGVSFWSSARKLSLRVKSIEQKIEDENIARSLRGEKPIVPGKNGGDVPVTPVSIFSQIHQLYIAPVIAGLLLAIVVYVLKLN